MLGATLACVLMLKWCKEAVCEIRMSSRIYVQALGAFSIGDEDEHQAIPELRWCLGFPSAFGVISCTGLSGGTTKNSRVLLVFLISNKTLLLVKTLENLYKKAFAKKKLY